MKPSAKKSNYLKIGEAAKALGVSIDTLRRWEKSGKITPIRTPGGTRLYHISTLNKLNPHTSEEYQAKAQTTEELLKMVSEDKVYEKQWNKTEKDLSSTIYLQGSTLHSVASTAKKSLFTKFLISTAVMSMITLVITSWITISYLANPKQAENLFGNNISSVAFAPFKKTIPKSYSCNITAEGSGVRLYCQKH